MSAPNLTCPGLGLRVTFVGTGEALDPDLANTSLLVQGERTLLLDCGYAVPHALWAITRDPDLLDGIYLSHLHADHAFGLPALLLWMRLSGRTRPLQLLGAGTAAAGALKIAERGYPGSFEASKCYALETVSLTEGHPHRWGDATLEVAASDHARMPNSALKITRHGVSAMYSGDGRPTPGTEALASDVDLLVHECFGDAAADTPPAHVSLDEVLALATRARVRRLRVLHHEATQREAIQARTREVAEDLPFDLASPGAGTCIQLEPASNGGSR